MNRSPACWETHGTQTSRTYWEPQTAHPHGRDEVRNLPPCVFSDSTVRQRNPLSCSRAAPEHAAADLGGGGMLWIGPQDRLSTEHAHTQDRAIRKFSNNTLSWTPFSLFSFWYADDPRAVLLCAVPRDSQGDFILVNTLLWLYVFQSVTLYSSWYMLLLSFCFDFSLLGCTSLYFSDFCWLLFVQPSTPADRNTATAHLTAAVQN